jgi:hypothetical protein
LQHVLATDLFNLSPYPAQEPDLRPTVTNNNDETATVSAQVGPPANDNIPANDTLLVDTAPEPRRGWKQPTTTPHPRSWAQPAPSRLEHCVWGLDATSCWVRRDRADAVCLCASFAAAHLTSASSATGDNQPRRYCFSFPLAATTTCRGVVTADTRPRGANAARPLLGCGATSTPSSLSETDVTDLTVGNLLATSFPP